MRRFYLLSCGLLMAFTAFAQSGFNTRVDELLSEFDRTDLSTGILYDRVFPIADLAETEFQGLDVDAQYFLQAYAELGEADYQDRFFQLEELKGIVNSAPEEDLIRFGYIIMDAQRVSPDAILEGRIQQDSEGKVIRLGDEPIFEEFSVHLASPLNKVVEGSRFSIALDSRFTIEGTDNGVEQLSVDFGDGYVTITENPITYEFARSGDYPVNMKMVMSDGEIIIQHSHIEVREAQVEYSFKSPPPGFETGILSVNASIPYQGVGEAQPILGRAQAKAFLDNVDGTFDKPILIVDGFDPGDTRGVNDIYGLLTISGTTDNLADQFRDQGYDVVILNFPTYNVDGATIDGGADFIQRNAFIFVEAIQQINERKVGNEEIIVIGPSMGGLISRIGLKYMEDNGMDHETRLWVSFDAPHLGANIPIGAQYLANYYARELGDQATENLLDLALRSAAAKQLLLDHVDAHLVNPNGVEQVNSLRLPDGAPGFRDAFQSELDALGFPQDCRNISLINGADNGTTVESPGVLGVNTTFNVAFGIDADVRLRYTPTAGNVNTVCDIEAFLFLFIPVLDFQARAESFPFTDGYDSAPGGTTDINEIIESFGEELAAFLDPNDITVDAFSFIPTYSALHLTGNIDQHAPVNPSDVNVFEAYYAPSVNEPHVTVTSDNSLFVIDEILNPGPPAAPGEGLADIFNLRSNPVLDGLWMELNGQYKDERLQLRILDMTGAVVQTEVLIEAGRYFYVSTDLANGIYLVEVNNGSTIDAERFIVSR